MVRLLVAPELRFLLPVRCRDGVVDAPRDPTASLAHVVQDVARIPLTEFGELAIVGTPPTPVPSSYQPGDEDVITVTARARPQPLDGPARFLLDVHLGALARRLRLLGVDTAYGNTASDDELVAQAAAEDRLLLTQDRGLLRRRALRRAAYVRHADPNDQVTDVLGRFTPPLAPYTRCPSCNGALVPVAKHLVEDRLEPGTRRTQNDFTHCVDCGRIYWRGAHAKRLDALVRRWTE